MDKTLSSLKQAESLVKKAIESLYQSKKLLLNVENDEISDEISDLIRFVTDTQFAADKATYKLYFSVRRQEKRIREKAE